MRKICKTRPQHNDSRAAPKPRKISNHEHKKFITLSFIWYTQSSDRKVRNSLV